MVSKTRIFNELKKIDRLYIVASKSADPDLQKLFSKLAILELCGWVEDSMDDIVRSHTKKKVKNPPSLRYLEDVIIKKNYSFTYTNHFRKMLIHAIGLLYVDKLESSIDSSVLHKFSVSLESLKRARDVHAHSYISGTTLYLFAPSWSLSMFVDIYNGLKEFEMVLKKI